MSLAAAAASSSLSSIASSSASAAAGAATGGVATAATAAGTIANASMTSSSASLAASAATAAAATSIIASGGGGGGGIGPLSTCVSCLSSFSNNKHWVGSAWILSSAILTTYSTTKFLKYRGLPSSSSSLPSSLILDNRGNGEKDVKESSQMMQSVREVIQSPQYLQNDPNNQRPLTKPSAGSSMSTSSAGLSRATLLTLYRFSGSFLLGLLLHPSVWKVSNFLLPRLLRTIVNAKLFLLPSLFLFVANYTNSIALDRIGISLTYTSKCGIPLITVLLTCLLDGVRSLPSAPTLLSLLPIAVGIGAASWNSPTFEIVGFLSAVISTTSQAALNVSSKKIMKRTGVRGVEAQRAMVLVALCIGVFMAVANRASAVMTEWRLAKGGIRGARNMMSADKSTSSISPSSVSSSVVSNQPDHPPLWLTALAVSSYHIEYVLSFLFVGLVEPITYGTCDALRRLLIIVTGRMLFGGDAFSRLNLGGIGLALLGALSYSISSSRGGGVVPNAAAGNVLMMVPPRKK